MSGEYLAKSSDITNTFDPPLARAKPDEQMTVSPEQAAYECRRERLLAAVLR